MSVKKRGVQLENSELYKKQIRIKPCKLFAMHAETKGARQMTSHQSSSILTTDWTTQGQYIH